MVKATAKNCANTLLSTRVANHFHRVANDAVHHLHCAIALEVTSNSSMVEHLSHKQNEPVRIRRRPRWGSQKHFFPLAQCEFNLCRGERMDYTQFLQKPGEVLKLATHAPTLASAPAPSKETPEAVTEPAPEAASAPEPVQAGRATVFTPQVVTFGRGASPRDSADRFRAGARSLGGLREGSPRFPVHPSETHFDF